MNLLTVYRFSELLAEAEAILKKDPIWAPPETVKIIRDYGMYRLYDLDFLAVGLSWYTPDGEIRSVKVQNGIITDYYVIYENNPMYRSAEVDPKTMEVLALYKIASTISEPKIDPKTGEVLQDNTYSSWENLPERYLKALREVKFPLLTSIYCWSDKPYGPCVEFYAAGL